MPYKIGQKIKLENERTIVGMLGGDPLTAKPGDQAWIDSKGWTHFLTGQAAGKVIIDNPVDVKGYDHNHIAALIFNRLDIHYDLTALLEESDIDKDSFIDEIWDILNEIL